MKTTDEIYKEMCAAFTDITGTEVTEGGDMAVRMYAAAAQIYSLYVYNHWVLEQSFPQTATGEYLDRHAEMRGISRNSAVYATGEIQFGIDETVQNDLEIQEGTLCRTAGGEAFVTTEKGCIAAGELSCTVPAAAVSAGESGNVTVGSITVMTAAPIGVKWCTNQGKFTGGCDAEKDTALRTRVLGSFSKLPNGVNAAYYEKEVLSTDGVAAVKVLPKNRGLGTVDVVISAWDGVPSSALLEKIRASLDKKRELCTDITVEAPETVSVDITASVSVEEGYDMTVVRANVEDALQKYFDGTLLGQDILRAKLGDIIFSVTGVKNYTLTLPTADLNVGDTELPVLGTLNIGDWS